MAVGDRERTDRKAWAFVAPALVWTGAFFVMPFAIIAAVSLWERVGSELVQSWSLVNYFAFFEKTHLLRGLLNSLEITLTVTAVSLLLAYPLAWFIAEKVPTRWQRLALILAILPFWTSYVVRSYAWLLILARNGLINQALLGLGLIDEPLELASTRTATIIGFVHFFRHAADADDLREPGATLAELPASCGGSGRERSSDLLARGPAAHAPGHHGRRVRDLRAVHRRLHHATGPRRQQRAGPAAGDHAADRPRARTFPWRPRCPSSS